MKLQLFKRTGQSKGEVNKMRREGKVPAVIYVKSKDAEAVAVESTELDAAMRQVLPGRLSTTILTLSTDNNKTRRVIIKDIQYHVTTYKVLHLDLEELHDNTPVTLNVPIECIGVVDCVGVKQGGTLNQARRNVRVKCLPKDIPSVFEVDVRNLGIEEPLRLSDLAIPNTIQSLTDLNEVAVVVVRKK